MVRVRVRVMLFDAVRSVTSQNLVAYGLGPTDQSQSTIRGCGRGLTD